MNHDYCSKHFNKRIIQGNDLKVQLGSCNGWCYVRWAKWSRCSCRTAHCDIGQAWSKCTIRCCQPTWIGNRSEIQAWDISCYVCCSKFNSHCTVHNLKVLFGIKHWHIPIRQESMTVEWGCYATNYKRCDNRWCDLPLFLSATGQACSAYDQLIAR